MKTAWMTGLDAHDRNERECSNPYAFLSADWWAWRAGFHFLKR